MCYLKEEENEKVILGGDGREYRCTYSSMC